VNHTLSVRIVERARDRIGDPDGLVDRKLVLTVEALSETLARHIGHDVEQEAVGLAGVEEGRMLRVL